MILKEVIPPEILEYNYNYGYVHKPEESNIDQHVDMTPFVYKEQSGMKKLVIIWEANLNDKATRTDILNLKMECCYILDCTQKSDEGFDRFRQLLKITCGFFSIYYQYLYIGHSVKLKNLDRYYVGLDHHFEILSPLLYDL